MDICGNSKFPSMIFSYDSVNKLINTSLRQRGIKQRYIFEITKQNVLYCKNLMNMRNDNNNNSLEVHHMNDIDANFALNETEYLGSITISEHNQQAIYSNVTEIVEQQHSIFETLWNKSIPAEDIVEEIEQGIEPEFFEIIVDSQKATEIYLNLAKSLQKEGLLLFADNRALVRAEKLGILYYLIKASSQKHAAIKIICPLDESNSEIVKQISQQAPDVKILNGGSSQSGLFIADQKECLRFDLKDPKAAEFSQAIGFIVHSNSKSSVSSSRSMFELIWNEHVQYQKIKEYERQKEADKIKDEFINIAAHELRTPIQPILGLTQIIYSMIDKDASQYQKEKQKEMLEVVIRNANRLQRLSEDILDVTRIESQNLNLKLERLNLDEIIANAINDAKRSHQIKDNVSLLYQRDKYDNNDCLFIHADRGRLNQVISNLISNAIRFTKEGSIIIHANKEENENKVGIVSVKDSGIGIDPEILPRLFQKFATKSYQGTGLGLYISKSIIEAHGGKMWAENNLDGKGSTFTFSLPLAHKNKNYSDI
jgi:two-component system, OmpR family, sensor histidine kinase VicK